MLYQPSYPSPYLSDVDGGKANVFSCYINADGGTTVTSYQYTITTYSGTNVYSSEVTPTTPLYAGDVLSFTVPVSVGLVNGSDYLWNITLYTEVPDIWVTYGTLQGVGSDTSTLLLRPNQFVQVGMFVQVGNQKSRITKLTTSDNKLQATITPAMTGIAGNEPYNVYNNNITSTDYYFRARTTPTLILSTIPETVTNKSYTFSATYTQAENVGFKYFEWTIYDVGGNVINRSGEKNSGSITYTFDGFINGSTYGVGLTLENQDGVILNISPKYFNVSYALPELENAPEAVVDCDKAAINVSWSPLAINNGIASASSGVATPYYEIVDNIPYFGGHSVKLKDKAQIDWFLGTEQEPIYIPYESTTYINWHTDDPNFAGDIYKQEGEYVNIVAISNVAPSTASIGDEYYNTVTKLIYTAIATNTWGIVGEHPRSDVVYKLTTTNANYLWDGSTLSVTTATTPSYKVSYLEGAFYYDIENGDISIHNKITIQEVQKSWLLQAQGTQTSNSYVWLDGLYWNDDLYWTETGIPYITNYWFKLTLLPDRLLVEKNETMN